MNKNKMKNIITRNKKHSSKLLAGLVSLFVIGLLILSGPANAFDLGLSIDDSTIDKGDNAVFSASIDIKSGENLPIDEVSLIISGAGNRVCIFNVDGSKISGCDGININLISETTSYGYGYGYGYYGYGYNFGYGYGYNGVGELVYEITIDSGDFSVGDYNALLRLFIDGKDFESDDVGFVVNDNVDDEDDDNSDHGGCRTDWVCREWSECINGEQIRDCVKVNKFCYADPKDKPIDQRNCSVDQGGENEEDEEINLEIQDEEGRLAGITGAVTGAVVGAVGTTGAWIIGVFLLGLIGLAIAVPVVRARRIRRIEAY